MGRRATSQGDVYSFGVLLLETVTRKRPTDMFCHENTSLHEWVKSHYPNKLETIIRQTLVKYPPLTPNTTSFNVNLLHDIVLEIIELGLICTQQNPSTRPTMLDVAHEIATWKDSSCNPLNGMHAYEEPRNGVHFHRSTNGSTQPCHSPCVLTAIVDRQLDPQELNFAKNSIDRLKPACRFVPRFNESTPRLHHTLGLL
ncbi:hypothetical protein R6Q59_023507 [Mikania micrantha]